MGIALRAAALLIGSMSTTSTKMIEQSLEEGVDSTSVSFGSVSFGYDG